MMSERVGASRRVNARSAAIRARIARSLRALLIPNGKTAEVCWHFASGYELVAGVVIDSRSPCVVLAICGSHIVFRVDSVLREGFMLKTWKNS